MDAAKPERLTSTEVECLLRRRLRAFIEAGASRGGALVLAAQVEISEAAAVQLIRRGFSAALTFRLLYRGEPAEAFARPPVSEGLSESVRR